MLKNEPRYEVVKWGEYEKNNRGWCNRKWSGEDLDSALAIASYFFVKEIVKAKYIEKGVLKLWEQEVDFSYADKVKCRITVRKIADPTDEARGKMPHMIKSFGNESIEVFLRYHLF